MIKKYTKQKSIQKAKENVKKEVVQFLLNYSQALDVIKTNKQKLTFIKN